jgi:hypothetical protein
MLVSTTQTCLSDKMPQNKYKFKNPYSNFAQSYLFSFFYFNFFGGHFVTKISLHFLNLHKILYFLHAM